MSIAPSETEIFSPAPCPTSCPAFCPVFCPFGLAASAMTADKQTNNTIKTAVCAGFLYRSTFLIRPPVSPSPKASGIPSTMRRPDANVSKDAAYSFLTPSPIFRITASSQDISMSLPLRIKASQTSGLNQWMQRIKKLTTLHR